MTGRPLSILLNPAAGAGRAGRERERLEAELKRQGVAYELTITESESHLRSLTRSLAAGRDRLAGAGGDSTLLIMLDEIMAAAARPRLGLIGIGSSNDIPREFGLDTLERACAALKSGTVRTVDVGVVETGSGAKRHFLGQANIGLGAEVNRFIAKLANKRPGLARRQTLAGFFGILGAYRSGRVPLELTIEGPGGSARGSYVSAVFANTRFWATGRIIAPQARPDDGLLDACLIGACSVRRLAGIDAAAKKGRHARRPEVTMLRSSEFHVSSPRDFFIQADGEIIPESGGPALGRTALFCILPAALEIFAPAPSPRETNQGER
jgi:diacylglycerol kinase family enzyme